VPVVAPTVIEGRTLHDIGTMAMPIPRRGGRWPDPVSPTIASHGGFLARLHLTGAAGPVPASAGLTSEIFGWDARSIVLDCPLVRVRRRQIRDLTQALLERTDAVLEACNFVASLRIHGDCHRGQHPVDRHRGAFRRSRRLHDGTRDPGPLDAAGGSREEDAPPDADYVEGYEQFRPFESGGARPHRAVRA